MAPKSRLIVYAIRSGNQEILVDATDFKVDGLFRNNVSRQRGFAEISVHNLMFIFISDHHLGCGLVRLACTFTPSFTAHINDHPMQVEY